jgi:drug/metabolite transporter (DMT)-like permease
MTAQSAAPPRRTARSGLGSGMAIAIVSAAAFGVSGPLAKALMESGWSPGAAVLVRVGGAALVLVVPVLLLAWNSCGRILVRHSRLLVGYGVIAIAGAQIGFFSAVQTLPVGVALLLEYLAPVIVVGWLWVTKGQRPGWLTAVGGAVAMIGLVLVLNLTSGGAFSLVGVAWALWAALCLTGYFLMSAHTHDDLPPVLVIGSGMIVGTLVIVVVGLVGFLPMAFSDAAATLGGHVVPWWVPALGLVLITSVFSYLTGIVAVRRLGSRLASFVALIEVLFAVLAAWIMLAELPTLQQLAGGVLIITGVVFVRLGEPQLEQEHGSQIEGAEAVPA